jgi:hypothetical protein
LEQSSFTHPPDGDGIDGLCIPDNYRMEMGNKSRFHQVELEFVYESLSFVQ